VGVGVGVHRRAECEEYAEVLEHHHVATVPELCVTSEDQLVCVCICMCLCFEFVCVRHI